MPAPAGREPFEPPPGVVPVRDRAEVEARVAALAPTLRALGVERVRLFGSFVRGEQTADSDVDLLVNFRYGDDAFRRYFDAIDALERSLGRPVDFVTEPSLRPHIGRHILREAVPLSTFPPTAAREVRDAA